MNQPEYDQLMSIGWTPALEQEFIARHGTTFVPGRVIRGGSRGCLLCTTAGDVPAVVTGGFEYRAAVASDFPTVGDWVAAEPSEASGAPYRIHAVLPRRTTVSRKRAGSENTEQILAANVDVVFIVLSCERDRTLSPRAVERYLTMVRAGGAKPVLLLNKVDLTADPEAAVARVIVAADGVQCFTTSAVSGAGTAGLSEALSGSRTGVLVGPSGTGKSSLINRLRGEPLQATAPVRGVDLKGRHTTTSRELILVPGGGLLIDTPGIRELQLWADEDDLAESFSDIGELSQRCRFRDCSHSGEPGCAVHSALMEGSLDQARYENYLELRRELAFLKRRNEERAQFDTKDRWKQIHRQMRNFTKEKRAGG